MTGFVAVGWELARTSPIFTGKGKKEMAIIDKNQLYAILLKSMKKKFKCNYWIISLIMIIMVYVDQSEFF